MSALASSQITPDRVELVITAGVFLQEHNTTRLTLQQLHEMGVRLALDDFGTGCSYLGYPRTASFSKITIYRSFIRGIHSLDGEHLPIIRVVDEPGASRRLIHNPQGPR